VQHVGSRGHGISTGTAHRVVMDTPERRLVSESSHQRGIVRKYKKNPDGSTTLISDSTCLDSQLNNNAYETPKRTPIRNFSDLKIKTLRIPTPEGKLTRLSPAVIA
jgi:hypothetical protein